MSEKMSFGSLSREELRKIMNPLTLTFLDQINSSSLNFEKIKEVQSYLPCSIRDKDNSALIAQKIDPMSMDGKAFISNVERQIEKATTEMNRLAELIKNNYKRIDPYISLGTNFEFDDEEFMRPYYEIWMKCKSKDDAEYAKALFETIPEFSGYLIFTRKPRSKEPEKVNSWIAIATKYYSALLCDSSEDVRLRQEERHDAIYAALTNGTPAPSIKEVFLLHTINEALRTCVDESKKFDTSVMQKNKK